MRMSNSYFLYFAIQCFITNYVTNVPLNLNSIVPNSKSYNSYEPGVPAVRNYTNTMGVWDDRIPENGLNYARQPIAFVATNSPFLAKLDSLRESGGKSFIDPSIPNLVGGDNETIIRRRRCRKRIILSADTVFRDELLPVGKALKGLISRQKAPPSNGVNGIGPPRSGRLIFGDKFAVSTLEGLPDPNLMSATSQTTVATNFFKQLMGESLVDTDNSISTSARPTFALNAFQKFPGLILLLDPLDCQTDEGGASPMSEIIERDTFDDNWAGGGGLQVPPALYPRPTSPSQVRLYDPEALNGTEQNFGPTRYPKSVKTFAPYAYALATDPDPTLALSAVESTTVLTNRSAGIVLGASTTPGPRRVSDSDAFTYIKTTSAPNAILERSPPITWPGGQGILNGIQPPPDGADPRPMMGGSDFERYKLDHAIDDLTALRRIYQATKS